MVGLKAAPLASGMRLVVDCPQTLYAYVRVNLGCRKARMAEEFLHVAQIGPSIEQVRRKAVPQRVRTHRTVSPQRARVPCHNPVDVPFRQRAPRTAEEQATA